MKLSYWCIPHVKHPTISIRTRTRREGELDFVRQEARGEMDKDKYHEPRKVVIEYKDGFDLMTKISSGEFVKLESAALAAPKADETEEQTEENAA